MASGTNERDDLNLTVEEDYEHLIEDYSHLAPPSEGELLQGHVVKVSPQEVIRRFRLQAGRRCAASSKSGSPTDPCLLSPATPST